MNMLRKFILPGLLAIACTAVGQNYNAEKVDRPNTKKITVSRRDSTLPCSWCLN